MGKIGAGVCFWLGPLGGGMEHMFKLNSRRRNVNMNKTGGAAAAGGVVLCCVKPHLAVWTLAGLCVGLTGARSCWSGRFCPEPPVLTEL